jgi:predicted transglutaminase-like cysteine proteinase
MQGTYKNRKMSSKTAKKDTRVRVQMTPDQYASLERIAKRFNMSVDMVVQRYVLRLIADQATP